MLPGPGRPKKPRTPDPQKRPPSAFLLFCRAERPKICRSCPGMSPSDVSSLLSQRWRTLDRHTKEWYKRQEFRPQQERMAFGEFMQPPPGIHIHPTPPPATPDLPHLSTDFMSEAPPHAAVSVDVLSRPAADQSPRPLPTPALTKRFDAQPPSAPR